jgi:hypothetical protein
VTCAAATRNMAAMAMPAAPTVAKGIAMFRSGTTTPPPIALAVVSPCILLPTNDDGPAFAHFPESISHVAPLEDAAIVAIVAIVAVVAIVVVIVAVADAVIESPVIIVLAVLRRPSLVAPSLSCRAAPSGCCIAASLSHWMAAGG